MQFHNKEALFFGIGEMCSRISRQSHDARGSSWWTFVSHGLEGELNMKCFLSCCFLCAHFFSVKKANQKPFWLNHETNSGLIKDKAYMPYSQISLKNSVLGYREDNNNKKDTEKPSNQWPYLYKDIFLSDIPVYLSHCFLFTFKTENLYKDNLGFLIVILFCRRGWNSGYK